MKEEDKWYAVKGALVLLGSIGGAQLTEGQLLKKARESLEKLKDFYEDAN